ncbi:DUF4139 domain-containing protein [Cystobacter ferrugineus]|uniref:Aspartate ammonia-lyase n=1 Tax=Cystobacter ferrugineus TaxID=83449 RepID=A0A1L9BEX8_9BACT|nr:DUF4139 domain-containing protein [Cystobacter ferrugineus]OJH40768.1 aspartate ammonia-lyase [Cystobacter ferrugineus]
MLVVPSTLDAVTVHAEGALCTRLASVPCERGNVPRQVRIEGLPLSLRIGSLRAAVLQGPAGLSVREVRPVLDVRLPPEADLPATQRALEEAQEKLATVSAELERLQRDLLTLRNLKPSFPPRPKDEPRPPREPALTSVLALADFVDKELATLHTRHLELERQQRDAVTEVELRRRRLEEGSSAVRGQRAQLHRAVVLTLSEAGSEAVAPDARVQLTLEYAVPGARWVPGYDLRMPRTLDGGSLRMRASILQRTGEDWSQVRVSLSTARLERRAEVPELKALRIGRRQPLPARSGWREPPPGLDELFTSYDAAQPSMPPPAAPPPPAPERTRVREFAMPPAPQRITQSVLPVVGGASRGGPGGGAPPPAVSAPPPPPSPAPSAAPLSAKRKAMAPVMRYQEEMDEESVKELSAEPAPSMDLLEEGEDTAPLTVERARSASRPSLPAEAPAPAELEPAVDLLDYASLELGSARDPEARGRLHPQREALSREQLVVLGVHLHVDVFALIASSEQEAEDLQQEEPPAWCVPPDHSTPHFDDRFDVETRVEVPSDGRWHTVPVFSAPVGLSPEYVCVPSVEPRVFRTVKVENRTPHALLAGPVDVTLGDEFLMTSPLPTLVPGATQRLGLGVEESLKVSRNTRFDELSGGMFNNNSTLMHHVRVELANRTSQRVTVEVRERVPAIPPSEKDIKVEESEVTPPWSKHTPPPGETPVEGERAWRLTLKPGETQTLSAAWSVRIPSNKVLVGGNRRT